MTSNAQNRKYLLAASSAGAGRSRRATRFPARTNRAGFTLIEVLVTLVLIGIVLPATMHGVTLAMHAGDAARYRNDAIQLAKSQLAQIVSGTQWASTTNLSGDFSPDWPGYQWKATVTPWDQDTSGMGIQQIDLTVSWQETGGTQTLTLSTLAYQRSQTQ